jgi:hypothetical protein
LPWDDKQRIKVKQVWPNYSYSPSTNVLTLTGLNIDRDQLLLVAAPERGRIMYNFADSSVTASSFTSGANTSLTLVASTAGLTTTASLIIYYDDQLQGNSVTISSLPAISGTVTANIPEFINETSVGKGIAIVGYNEGDDSLNILGTSNVDHRALKVEPISLPAISGTVEVNDVQSVVRIYDGDGSVFGLDRTFPINGHVDVDSLPSIVGTVTANLSSTNLNSVTIGVRGTVTVGNSITVGSLPVQLSTTTIGGTARLNVTLSSATTIGATAPSYGNLYGGSDGTNLRAILVDSSGRTTVTGSVSILGTPSVTMGAIAGAVTMYGVDVHGGIRNLSTSDLSESPDQASGNALLVKIMDNTGNQNIPLTNTALRATAVTIAGTVTANLSSVPTHGVTLTSTTVTVSALPSGALTTRFGSVTTGGTSQLTSCVTNTGRKYLLCQNIDTATVTIGIGFSPTTTQGIQLAPGAGISFDAFCPTGAVWWLGGTGANFSILEG